MKLLKHYERTLHHLLQPFIYTGGFPATEAARILNYLDGDSEETIMSLSADEVTKAARKRLFEEAESKFAKRKAKNKLAAERARAKRTLKQQTTPQEINE